MLKLQFKDRRRESVWLVDVQFSIGKSKSNSLMIEDPSLDDSHAEIIQDLNQLSLVKKTSKGIVKINGKEITPFLLDRIKSLTGGESLKANIELVLNNARVASKLSVELTKLG